MAISHAQTLVLFFASLLFLPAYGTKVQYCISYTRSPVKIKTVKISPYPVKRSSNANFTLIGSTNKEIPKGAIAKIYLTAPQEVVSTKTYSICDITACPVKPGPIVLTFPNVFTKTELRGFGYYVWISLAEDADEEKDKMMCVVFSCKIERGFESMLHQATE